MDSAIFVDPAATAARVIRVNGARYTKVAATSQPLRPGAARTIQADAIQAELSTCDDCESCSGPDCSGSAFTVTLTFNWSAADYELYTGTPGGPPEPGVLTIAPEPSSIASACLLCFGGGLDLCEFFGGGAALDNAYLFPDPIFHGTFGLDWQCDPFTQVTTAYLMDGLFDELYFTMDITDLLSCSGGKPNGGFTISYGSGTTCTVTVA